MPADTLQKSDKKTDTKTNVWPRRVVLGLLSAGFCLPLVGGPVHAAEAGNATKGGAWLLGENLSLAALFYNQGGATEKMNRLLAKAKALADILGVQIKPFPAKAAKSSEATADVIHYLIKGDGALIGVALAKKYDDEHAILFEVAVKSNLLLLMYGPGEDLGQTIAGVIKTRLDSIHLPARLWMDVVTAVSNKRPTDEVKDAVFKMHTDIANFYIPGTGG